MDILDKVSRYLNQFLIWIGGCFLIIMIVLTCSNIFFRLVSVPIRGTFELMGFFGALISAFAMGNTQIKGGHIAVDILVLRFTKRTQKVLKCINCFICMVFFILAAWQIAVYAANLWKTGEVTETLQIIYFPFTYCVALGCATLALVFLSDFLKLIFQKKRDET